MNEIENNIFSNLENENLGISTQAYYDYYEVVTREDTIISKLDNQYNMLIDGIHFFEFMFTLFLLYYFIRNLMGRS